MAYDYYGVRIGRVPGVYDNWPETQDQVEGYPGHRFKGFDTYEEAEAFSFGGVPDQLEVRVRGRVRRFPLNPSLLAALQAAGLDI